MSDKVLIKKETMIGLADAIREKTGKSESYKPSEMAGAVASIETGSSDGISMEEAVYLLSCDAGNANILPQTYNFKYKGEFSAFMKYKQVPEGFDYTFDITEFSPSSEGSFQYFGISTLSNTNNSKRTLRFPFCAETKQSGTFFYSKATHIYLNELTNIKLSFFKQTYNLRYLYMPKLKAIDTTSFYLAGNTTKGLSIYTKDLTSIDASFENCRLKELILAGDNVVKLSNSSYFSSVNTPSEIESFSIFVKDELVEEYKLATNWSVYADKIKPISEWGGEPE